jgi:L-ascorbate metabolism protein UlaG (beta-lactamase superfamily)
MATRRSTRAAGVVALLSLVALGVAATPAVPAARQEGVTITLLANEGVLLAGDTPAGPRKVLIDALYLAYDGYALPPEATQAALRSARAPFDATSLVLVTHRHGDHFHPAQVAAHLRANPRAVLLTSRQVIDSLRHHADARTLASTRIMARTTPPGARRRETVDGVRVELLGLRHGYWRNRRVEHLAYVVELGGRRVLHLGDAELSEATLAPLRLDTARIDVALVPAWGITEVEARAAIRRWVRPRHVVAIHLPPGEAGVRVAREVQAAWPGAAPLVRPLESRGW